MRIYMCILNLVLSIPDRASMPVRLLHLPFREFLIDSLKEKHPFWVDERARRERIASRCLQLMSGPAGLRHNICDLPFGVLRSSVSQEKIASHLPLELQYACRYWTYHIEKSESSICEGDSTDIFLQKQFLHWLEAMSLIG